MKIEIDDDQLDFFAIISFSVFCIFVACLIVISFVKYGPFFFFVLFSFLWIPFVFYRDKKEKDARREEFIELNNCVGRLETRFINSCKEFDERLKKNTC